MVLKKMTQKCIEHTRKKFVVVERFIRILRNKICKYMTSVSKTYQIDKLDEINKYSNNFHRKIKIMPVEVNPSMYVNFNK